MCRDFDLLLNIIIEHYPIWNYSSGQNNDQGKSPTEEEPTEREGRRLHSHAMFRVTRHIYQCRKEISQRLYY